MSSVQHVFMESKNVALGELKDRFNQKSRKQRNQVNAYQSINLFQELQDWWRKQQESSRQADIWWLPYLWITILISITFIFKNQHQHKKRLTPKTNLRPSAKKEEYPFFIIMPTMAYLHQMHLISDELSQEKIT